MRVLGAVEGAVDAAVLRQLLQEAGHEPGPIHVKDGKQNLLQKLGGYNAAAALQPWVVLVDLDGDADCAPPFIATHLPEPSPHMLFRVAVRKVESWLLADRARLASFLHVPAGRIPSGPDRLQDPKQALVNVARRSRRRAIRDEIVPRPTSGRPTGPAYVPAIIEFIEAHWQPSEAAIHSDSLRRCRECLASL